MGGSIMAGFLDNVSIDIPCPKCGRKTKKTIGWVKANKKFTCGCGVEVVLDAGQFRGEIAKAERAEADFKKALKGLGK